MSERTIAFHSLISFVLFRHRRGYARLIVPVPTGQASTLEFEQEIQTQIESLDAMFGDPGLTALRTKSPLHPAVIRRETLSAFLPRRPRPFEELLTIAAELGGTMIDRQFWMPDPRTPDYWGFISHEAAARRISQNLADPLKYNETLAEVRTWAGLRQNGLDVELVHEHGQPDLVIARGSPAEIRAEVKFVHTDTSDRGVIGAVEKANKQLRGASSGAAGVAYVHLDRRHSVRTLPATPAKADAARLPSGEDPPPTDVVHRIGLIERALDGERYKSVGVAIVTWEDHVYIGDWPGPVTYFVRRQSVFRRHRNMRPLAPIDEDAFRPGGWFATRIGIPLPT
jgi:hypothetical protein